MVFIEYMPFAIKIKSSFANSGRGIHPIDSTRSPVSDHIPVVTGTTATGEGQEECISIGENEIDTFLFFKFFVRSLDRRESAKGRNTESRRARVIDSLVFLLDTAEVIRAVGIGVPQVERAA